MKIIQKFLREGIKGCLSKKSTSYTKTKIGVADDPEWKGKHKLKDAKWKKLTGEEHTIVDTPQGKVPLQIAKHGKSAIQGYFDKQTRRSQDRKSVV